MSPTALLRSIADAYDDLAPYYDTFTAGYDHGAWVRTLESLAKEHGLAGRRALDVACGTGRSFEPLVRLGYEVTAFDASRRMLALARERAARSRTTVLYRDMRDPGPLGAHDLVLCLSDALNYLLDESDLIAALAGIRRNLAPNGVAVIDLNTLWCYRHFFSSATVVTTDEVVLVWRGLADAELASGDCARAELSAFAPQEGGFWQEVVTLHQQRHHPPEVMTRAIARAGLACCGIYGQPLNAPVEAALDELRHSKSVYVLRRGTLESERR